MFALSTGFLLLVGILASAHAGRSFATLAPCHLVAPTTRGVLVFVSDAGRALHWYQENAGLAETGRRIDRSLNNALTVDIARGAAGLTLIESKGFTPSAQLPQMVCLVLDGPPAPPAGSHARYLKDPDGTNIEIPPLSSIPELAH